MTDHFELDGKHAVVVHPGTPAGAALESVYREAGARVTVVSKPEEINHLDLVDVLACAPDVFLAKPIGDISDSDLAAIMHANFTVQFQAVRAASSKLGNGGRIVLLTSVLGERGLPNCTAYSAAQGAVQNFIRAAAQEFAPLGISINGIALGWMDWMSDRIDPQDEEAQRAVRFTIQKSRGVAEDIGPLAVWLSGTGAGFVSGQIYALDGGLLQHL